MKQFRRIAALVLCLSLCVSLAGCTDGNISFEERPDTPPVSVIPPSERDVVDCSDLVYEPFDQQAFMDRLDAARAVWQQEDMQDVVLSDYYALTDLLTQCLTSYKISEVLYYSDYANEKLMQDNTAAFAVVNDCNDAYCVYLSDLLKSDYRKAYMDEVGAENALLYEDYQAMTDEQKALTEQEKALEDQYTQLAGENYADYAATAAAMAPVYVQLIDVRNRLAESYGYDDYPTYAYENIYVRGYTPEDARELEEIVKGSLSGLYISSLLSQSQEDYDAFYRYGGADEETLITLMQEYMPRMSVGLAETLDYMLACGSYDITYSDKKYDASFTTMLNGLNSPYLFSQPDPESLVYSLGTMVHEFGHYYSFLNDPTFATSDGYVYSLDDIDVAEINSTGLELLFLHYYPELYGSDAQTLQRSVLSDILSNVIMGCIFDEFQQVLYTTENLQADQISSIFYDVFTDYMGDIFIEDYSYNMWALVNHNFDAPMYYISYGVSALAAFQIWEASQTDFDGALQQYLTLTAYGTNVDFMLLLEACDMENVFTEEYLDGLYDTLAGILL